MLAQNLSPKPSSNGHVLTPEEALEIADILESIGCLEMVMAAQTSNYPEIPWTDSGDN
jgi:hypothetical protein